MPEDIQFPIRINRYLALKGLATRRGADELVSAGLVRLNGEKAKLGDQVKETDTVEVEKGKKSSEKKLVYIAYYKPRGIITHSPQEGEQAIGDIAGFPGTFPIGRLDKASEGLIILTNDGRITERLLHPRFAHEKEYTVTVREEVLPAVRKILEEGVKSDNEWLKAKKVTLSGAHTLIIVLTQGKKHQIRRMLDGVRLTVEKLVRTRIMGVYVGALKPGKARFLEDKAKKAFLDSLDLPENP